MQVGRPFSPPIYSVEPDESKSLLYFEEFQFGKLFAVDSKIAHQNLNVSK